MYYSLDMSAEYIKLCFFAHVKISLFYQAYCGHNPQEPSSSTSVLLTRKKRGRVIRWTWSHLHASPSPAIFCRATPIRGDGRIGCVFRRPLPTAVQSGQPASLCGSHRKQREREAGKQRENQGMDSRTGLYKQVCEKEGEGMREREGEGERERERERNNWKCFVITKRRQVASSRSGQWNRQPSANSTPNWMSSRCCRGWPVSLTLPIQPVLKR